MGGSITSGSSDRSASARIDIDDVDADLSPPRQGGLPFHSSSSSDCGAARGYLVFQRENGERGRDREQSGTRAQAAGEASASGRAPLHPNTMTVQHSTTHARPQRRQIGLDLSRSPPLNGERRESSEDTLAKSGRGRETYGRKRRVSDPTTPPFSVAGGGGSGQGSFAASPPLSPLLLSQPWPFSHARVALPPQLSINITSSGSSADLLGGGGRSVAQQRRMITNGITTTTTTIEGGNGNGSGNNNTSSSSGGSSVAQLPGPRQSDAEMAAAFATLDRNARSPMSSSTTGTYVRSTHTLNYAF